METEPAMDSEQEGGEESRMGDNQGVSSPMEPKPSYTDGNLEGATKSLSGALTNTVNTEDVCTDRVKDSDSTLAKATETLDLLGTTEMLKVATIEQELLKAATASDKRVGRTLEDAIWKENTKDFLIVADDVLTMLDCTLMI